MSRSTLSVVVPILLLVTSPALAAAIDIDYLAQARLRGDLAPAPAPAQPAAVTTKEDAAGAVDGIKNGQWGFHTGLNDKPAWWRVDLGQSQRLARIVLYNRCDIPTRTAKLEIHLSADGQTWHAAYRHDGSAFCGFTDRKPLAVDLAGAAARYVRLQIPAGYFHLDEVEVYGAADPRTNIARGKPADQSSVSQWSKKAGQSIPGAPNTTTGAEPQTYPIERTLESARRLAGELKRMNVDTAAAESELGAIGTASKSAAADRKSLYLRARAAARKLALANPLLDFDSIVFVKRAPGTYSHMSDQYYSWWSRPGGGVFVLQNFKSESPILRCLTASFPEGSFLSPDLSYDGKRVLFAYCRFVPGRRDLKDKVDKAAQPEDSFYHVFEMNLDGTGVRQLTRGKYDDTFPRYLPDGRIAFLSTRRGTFLQCNAASAEATRHAALPDSYVRCGGGPSRPVALYTIHSMRADGSDLRQVSAFESFEWDPTVAADGRIFYARWDYVDRFNGPYMKLWATNPDGTNPAIVWGNYTKNPQSIFEARSVPGSTKIIATASAHHSVTAGSLVLIDPDTGLQDGTETLSRLTPEVRFPETEGWPTSYYASPWPLSETFYLCAWSDKPLLHEGKTNPPNALGLYLYDAFGNLEPLYRDPEISSAYPIPVRPRPLPPARPSSVDWAGPQVGTVVVQDVYQGLAGIERGSIKALRVVAMPVKVQPTMHSPPIGVTREDPGKLVLGTVPVEADGSAHFRLPSGVSVFFQALDDRGRAVQTMRSLTYVQPGQTLTCIGCHERRTAAPAQAARPVAGLREPSKLTPGPDGTWPLRFDKLVTPVLDAHCVSCHAPGSGDAAAARFDLAGPRAYDTLVNWSKPSIAELVKKPHMEGRSIPGQGISHASPLLPLFEGEKGHYGVKLTPEARARLAVWLDTYAQRQGSFSDQQEKDLLDFRQRIVDLLDERPDSSRASPVTATAP